MGRISGVVLACLALADILTTSPDPGAAVEREGDAIAVALALVVTLPLAVIDRFPRGVTLLSFGAVLVSAAIVLDERPEGPEPAVVVQTAAFRIVQESLSNVMKHARPAHVRILVERSESELRVEVHDDGKGTNGPWQAGHGLLGMRERAEALGGALEAGPASDGGWRVVASLPTSPGSP